MPDSSIKFSSRGAFSYNWNKCIDNERTFFVRLAKSMAGFFIGLFCGYTVTKTEVVILIKHGDYKDSIFYKEYSTELECRKAKKANGISIINNEKKKESVNNKETNKQEPLKINIDETIKTKVVSVKISLLDHLKELINSENFDLSDEAFSTANLQSLDAADALLLFNSALANNGFKCNKIALRLLKETECKQLFGNLTGTEKEKALLFIASVGCAISLEKLLSHDRKGINCQNSFACTPLLITVIENNVECLRVLLKYNTAVNMSNSCGL